MIKVEKISTFTIFAFLASLLYFRTIEASTEIAETVHIICRELDNSRFLHPSFFFLPPFYRCGNDDGRINLVTSPNSEVRMITRQNGSPVTNTHQIEMLDFWNMRINYIPKNIKAKFPNLKVIRFEITKLLSVSRENMQQFGNSLEFVCFAGNQLTWLDRDLFESNPNLKVIYLHDNPIRYIDPAFFETLKKFRNLRLLNLSRLKCTNQFFTGGDIAIFKSKNEKCFNESERPLTTTSIPSTTCPVVTEKPHHIDRRDENDNCCLHSCTLEEELDTSSEIINESLTKIGDSTEKLIVDQNNQLKDFFASLEKRFVNQENIIQSLENLIANERKIVWELVVLELKIQLPDWRSTLCQLGFAWFGKRAAPAVPRNYFTIMRRESKDIDKPSQVLEHCRATLQIRD